MNYILQGCYGDSQANFIFFLIKRLSWNLEVQKCELGTWMRSHHFLPFFILGSNLFPTIGFIQSQNKIATLEIILSAQSRICRIRFSIYSYFNFNFNFSFKGCFINIHLRPVLDNKLKWVVYEHKVCIAAIHLLGKQYITLMK